MPKPLKIKDSTLLSKMHPTGIEPTHLAPEASALSTELRVQVVFYYKLRAFAIIFLKKVFKKGAEKQLWLTKWAFFVKIKRIEKEVYYEDEP